MPVQVAAGRAGEPAADRVAGQGELSAVDTRVTPLVLSLSRHRTVSSRGPREVAELVDDYVLGGRFVPGGFAHHPLEVVPDTGRIVVAGDYVKFVALAERLAVAGLEFPGIFLGVVASGFIGVDGGLTRGR